MKLTKESMLFEVPSGSHLFGTSTPTSDVDSKIVALPLLEDLIMLRRIENAVVKPEGVGAGGKMMPGEHEYEVIPLQIFLDHFFEGQTYALEIAFAVLNDRHTPSELYNVRHMKSWMSMLVNNFLTRDIRKMVGYARSQSQLYGLKTERFNAMLQMQAKIATRDATSRVSSDEEFLQEMLATDFVKEIQIANGQGGKVDVPGIELNGKQFPLTSTWGTVYKSVSKTVSGYGGRVTGHVNQPADWKALSHAIRIGEQILELLADKAITFPRPNAAFLVDVKQGKIALDDATNYLTKIFNEVEEATKSSSLPEKTEELIAEFEKFKLDLLKDYYDEGL